jgi:hypothetical protein
MKPAHTFLTALLLAPLAAVNAAESPEKLHPYVTAGDPNISRAFRIAVGDISSNLAPLDGAASLTAAPLSKKRWEALSAKVVEIAGTRDVIPERPSFLIAGLDYGMYQFDTMMHAWDGASFLVPDAVKGALFNTLVMSEDGRVRSGDFITGFGWAVGAWEHYLHTGDRAFLKVALAATLGSFAHYERMEFDPQLGLFRGPAILCDGISSYPDFWVIGLTGKGHIIKWPENHPDKKAPVGLGLPMPVSAETGDGLHGLGSVEGEAHVGVAKAGEQELDYPAVYLVVFRDEDIERMSAGEIGVEAWRGGGGPGLGRGC